MKVHDLKCWPESFFCIAVGVKRFELRRNDRDFKQDDVLHLREWRPDREEYTGSEQLALVTHVMTAEHAAAFAGKSLDRPIGIAWCILSIKLLEPVR